MSSLTPRGWFVLGCLAAAAAWLLVMVSACLWWVGIDSPQADFFGWCWGSMSQCVKF